MSHSSSVARFGSRFMVFGGTLSTQFPTNGIGGATTTAASSELVSVGYTLIYGILIWTTEAASASTIMVENTDGGTTYFTINLSVAASYVTTFPMWIPFGPAGEGIRVPGGMSTTCSTAGHQGLIFYNVGPKELAP